MASDMPPTTTPRYGASQASGHLPKPRPETAYARTARALGKAERTIERGIPEAFHLLLTHVDSIRSTQGDEAALLFVAPFELALLPATDPLDVLMVAEEQADGHESNEQVSYLLNRCRDTARSWHGALLRQAHRSYRVAAALGREWKL